MGQRLLELVFAGGDEPQLVEIRFTDRVASRTCVSVRGKTSGAFRDVGTFQWTSAVRAMCSLMVRTKIASLDEGEPVMVGITGGLGSSAASLDYALTKQPRWICEMFGTDGRGSALAQRLFLRTNSNRKRPGPVTIAVNEKLLAASDLSIFLENQRIDSIEKLQGLSLLVDGALRPRAEVAKAVKIAA
jgi:hypothetical protein